MSNRLLHGPRFSIGNQAPVWPYALNRDSDQARNLTLWLPGDLLTAARATNFGHYPSHGTPNSFEAAWSGVNDFGGRAFNLNSGGNTDNDYIRFAADPRLTVSDGAGNDRDITISCWVYLRSYGLSNTGNPNRGRIYGKDGVEFYFNNTDLSWLRFKSSTSLERRAAPPALNAVHHLAVTSRANDTAADTHIYINGVEVSSYTTSIDAGAGNYFNDGSTDLWIGNAPFSGANGRLFDGLLCDLRVYYDRIMSPREVWALYDPQTRFELFEEEHTPGVWPSLGAVTASVNASLQAALRRQTSLLASVDAALRAELTLTAAADAALAQAFFGAAGLDAAAQAIRAAQTDLDTALRRTLVRGAGLDANLTGLGLSQRFAALDGAVRRLNTLSANLQAALRTEAQGVAQFDAMLAFEAQRFAGLDAVTQLRSGLRESVLEAALRATGSRAAALDAIVGLVAAAAAGRTFKVTASRSHGVAALGRRAAIPSGKRRH